MSWYRTGTIALTNGSATVTGTGTDWISGAAVGEGLLAPDGKVYEVYAIVSAVSITLGSVYLGSTASGQSYAIMPSQSYIRALAAQAATLVNQYQDVKDTVGSGKFPDGTVGAPGFSWVADTDTGMRRTGTNAMAAVAGGADQVLIDTNGLSVQDGKLRITGSADATKIAVFEVDGLTTATTRTFTLPNANTTLVGTDTTQTLTAKTLTTPVINGFTGTGNATVTGNLTITNNVALGDAEATDTHAIKGATTLLANSASAALRVTQTGAGNAFVVEDSASTDSTPFVIDANGRTFIGAGVGYIGLFNSAFLQVHNVGGNTAQSILRYSADDFSPDIDFCKSRNATTGSHTIVQSGDDLGTLRFAGSDGANFIQGASIFAEVDGTPGTNDMPGRLVFSTTADGAASPTERMRIDSAGIITIAAGQIKFPATQNASADANTLDDYEEGTFTPVVKDGAAGNAATAASAGFYTKVGNTVHATISLVDINTTGLTAGNQVHITGLPFGSVNTANRYVACSVLSTSTTPTTGAIAGLLVNNASSFPLYNATTAGAGYFLVSQLTSGTADLYITFTYQTA